MGMFFERRCPYCNAVISDSANKCRHCGEWLISEKEKKQAAKVWNLKGFRLCGSPSAFGSASAALRPAFLFTRFFEVSSVAKFLEGAFFVEFLLESAESAVDRLAFFQSDFGCFHCFHPPSLLSW